jgi:hypothetical protein
MKTIRTILAAVFAVAAVAVAGTTAFAATATSQSGNVQLSVPTTVSVTGFTGQTTSGSGAAGTSVTFGDLTGVSASTNSLTGLTLTQQSIALNHWDTSPPSANFIAASADTISVTACPATATCTSGALANNGSPANLLVTTAPGTVGPFAIHNVILVPATLPPGNYYNQIILTATAA